jgi:hypothetical protein
MEIVKFPHLIVNGRFNSSTAIDIACIILLCNRENPFHDEKEPLKCLKVMANRQIKLVLQFVFVPQQKHLIGKPYNFNITSATLRHTEKMQMSQQHHSTN